MAARFPTDKIFINLFVYQTKRNSIPPAKIKGLKKFPLDFFGY